jgi:hypothetical protein
LRARRCTSTGKAANICLNLGVVEEFIRWAGPSMSDVLINFLQQEIKRTGSRISFDLPVPFAIAFGIEPLLQFDKLTGGKFGDGLFDFDNGTHVLTLASNWPWIQASVGGTDPDARVLDKLGMTA